MGAAGEAAGGLGAPPLGDHASLCRQGESGEPGPKGQVSPAPATPPSSSPADPRIAQCCGRTANPQAPRPSRPAPSHPAPPPSTVPPTRPSSPFYISSPFGRVRSLTWLCALPTPAARSPWRTGLPGPQRGCGRPRGTGLPGAPRPSRTGWRPWRARTARETGRGGELAPRPGGGISWIGNPFGVLLMPQRLGAPRRSWRA